MTRAAEPFVRVPRRLLYAMQRGELTPTSFAVLLVLVDEVDRRSGIAAFKLADLAERLSWKWSAEWLRRNLSGLRRAGWIAYESKPGQRGKYLIELREAALLTSNASGESRDDPHATFNRPPTDLQLSDLQRDPATESYDMAPEARSSASATSNSRARAREDDKTRRRREEQQQQKDSSTFNATSNSTADEDEPPELAEALGALERADRSPLIRGRSEVVSAYYVDRAGTLALIRDLAERRREGGLKSGRATLVSAIRNGDHRDAGERLQRTAPCRECETGGGRHREDCPLAGGAA